MDPITNTIYTHNQYNYDNQLDDEEGNIEDNDGEQSEIEDEQESNQADDIFADDLVCAIKLYYFTCIL